jgi:hypothetical protein
MHDPGQSRFLRACSHYSERRLLPVCCRPARLAGYLGANRPPAIPITFVIRRGADEGSVRR